MTHDVLLLLPPEDDDADDDPEAMDESEAELELAEDIFPLVICLCRTGRHVNRYFGQFYINSDTVKFLT